MIYFKIILLSFFYANKMLGFVSGPIRDNVIILFVVIYLDINVEVCNPLDLYCEKIEIKKLA